MMTPAKEVGGDLYAYALIDNLLYFCVGDVSGKVDDMHGKTLFIYTDGINEAEPSDDLTKMCIIMK